MTENEKDYIIIGHKRYDNCSFGEALRRWYEERQQEKIKLREIEAMERLARAMETEHKPHNHNSATDGLPSALNTGLAQKAFAKAIEVGWMEKTRDGYKWFGVGVRGKLAQLAYFCGRIYGYEYGIYGNQGGEFPEQDLCKLFGVERIYKQLVQAYDAKKKQRWRDIIDGIFQ